MTNFSTTAASTDLVWRTWTDTSTTATATIDPVWATWCDTAATTTGTVTISPWATWVYEVEQTQEVRAAADARRQEAQRVADARRQEAQRAADEREAKRREAERVAEATLKTLLTPEQQEAWEKNRAIFVTGQSGTRYRIRHGSHGNITEYDAAGKQIASLCVNVPPELPLTDNVIAQLLALQFNEAMLLRLANRREIRA